MTALIVYSSYQVGYSKAESN